MPLSSMTAIPQIAEGSEATPGLWNRAFSQISQNIAEINALALGPTATAIIRGSGSPEGVIDADPGIGYQDILGTSDTTHWNWIKGSGTGNTGWVPNEGFGGSGARSLHLGYGSVASAENAVAMAPGSIAGGSGAVAAGYQAQALRAGGAAIGLNARALRDNDSAFGINSFVSGPGSGVFGSTNTSTATGAYVLGVGGQNSGVSSVLFTSAGGSNSTGTAFVVDYPVTWVNGDIRATLGKSSFSLVNMNNLPPASGTGAGVAGDITWSSSGSLGFLYLCVSTNSWRRVNMVGF
jgi:hypothetical protein